MSLATRTVQQLLDDLSARTPTPGGGAVAGLAAAMAASLALMVVRYSIGKKQLAQHEESLRQAEESLKDLRALFVSLADEDAVAYATLSDAMKINADDPTQEERMAGAAFGAMNVPARLLDVSHELLVLLAQLPARTSHRLASDLAIAASLGGVAAEAAIENVLVNASLLAESSHVAEADAITSSSRDACRRAVTLAREIRDACATQADSSS